MTARQVVRPTVLVLLAVLAVVVWRGRMTDEERAIRDRLSALRGEVNASAADGLANVTRAARIGGYFTDEAVVDLGEGAPPIRGRDTLMGMAARLQPRTAAFRMDLDDVSVELVPGGEAADVILTASFVSSSVATGEESRDAREFALVLVKSDGPWRISRVTAIDTFR